MTALSTDGTSLDRTVSDLREHAASRAAGARAKGFAAESAWAAEDWFSAPWALNQNIQALPGRRLPRSCRLRSA